MTLPYLQFYVNDWQGNANLKRCSHAEKGIWLDVLCLLHTSDDYGLLRWPLKDIAQAVGCPLPLLLGLYSKDVLKGCERGQQCPPYIFTPRHAGKSGAPVTLIEAQPGPVWYSSRMVRDHYVRSQRGNQTHFKRHHADTEVEALPSPTGSPKPPIGDTPMPTPMPPIGEPKGDGLSSSSSSSDIKTPPPEIKAAPARRHRPPVDNSLRCPGWDLRPHLSDQQLDHARRRAPGWDIYGLIATYNAGVEKRGIPGKPAAAFMAWIPRYTKGRQP